MRWKRDVFCAACGAYIDTVETPQMQENGQVEAMIVGDSRRAHMQATGCHGIGPAGDAWNFGDWIETKGGE